MPFIIDIDNDEFTVPDALWNRLDAEDLIAFCEECSSEFSARCVGHPTNGNEERVRTVLTTTPAPG